MRLGNTVSINTSMSLSETVLLLIMAFAFADENKASYTTNIMGWIPHRALSSQEDEAANINDIDGLPTWRPP